MKTFNIPETSILLIGSILLTLLLMKNCSKPNIITKTDTKTITKTHTDTLYITRNNTLYVNKYITLKDTIKDNRKQIKQKFNLKDSILDLTVFTLANDTVNELTIDYKFEQPTITKTDSVFINTTITLHNKEFEDKYNKLKSKQPERFLNALGLGLLSGIIYNLIKK